MKPTLIRSLPLTITLIASAAAQSLQDGLIAYYDFEEVGAAGIANKAPGVTDHDGVYLGDISSIAGAGAGFAGDAAYSGAVATNTTDRSQLLAGNALNVAKANTGATAGRGQFQVSTLTSRGTGVDGGGTMGTEFTVSAWFFAARDADNTSTTGDIIRNTVFETVLDGATNGLVYDISWATTGNNSSYVPYINTVSGPASTLANNQWHHVIHTVTSDGATSTLNSYVNGTLGATITAPTNTVDFRGINFGAHRGGGRIFDGLIDEVAVWDRAMDETEVAAVHALGMAGLPLIEADDGGFLFWDANGATAGAGGEAPSGNWANDNWSADPAGASATTAWVDGSTAVFAAGDDATGNYTVALDGTRVAREIRVQNGNVTLQGGTLELTGPALLRAMGSGGLTVSSAISAPSLATRGDVALQSAATIPGPLTAIGGTLTLTNGFSFGGVTGNSTLDLASGSLTLNPAADTTGAFSGALAGDGVVVKSGEGVQVFNRTDDGFDGGFTVEGGILVLAGVKTHSGANQVNGGQLVASGNLFGSLDISAGASLSIGSTPGGGERARLTLEALGNSINGNLILDLNGIDQTPGGGVNDLVEFLEDATFGPDATITPRFSGGLPLPGDSYEIVWVYGTRSGLPAVDPAFQALTRYIFETQSGSAYPDDVQLTITGGAAEFLVWAGDGLSNVWQTGGDQNWLLGASPSAFLIPDNVEFDDTGDNSLPILVTGEVMPSSIVVDADASGYVWAGDGVILGNTGLDKYGSAELTLLNRNEFDGEVRIFEGGITVGDGGITGTLGGAGDIQVSDGASLTFDRSDLVTASRRIVGGGDLVQAGLGTLTLTGNNTYTGETLVRAGTLEFAGSGRTSADSDLTVEDGGLLRFAKNDTWGNHNTWDTPVLTIDDGGVVESNGTYTTLTNLVLNGGNLRTSGGANTNYPAFGLKGSVIVNATDEGSFISTTGSGSFNTVTIGSEISGSTTTFQVADGAAAVDLTVEVPLHNMAGHTSNLLKTGEGTMLLTAASTYTGTTTISEGTLQVGNGGTVGSLAGGDVVNNAALEINRSDPTAIANSISGSGSLAITGDGQITLSGNNAYSGGTTASSGGVVAASNTAFGTGAVVVNGASFESAPGVEIANNLTLSGGATARVAESTGLGSGNVTLNGASILVGDGVELANEIVLQGAASSNVFNGTIEIDYLLVGGGGGGGGRDSSGGGGGGGVISNVLASSAGLPVASGEAVQLTVGAGGAGGGVSSGGGAAGQGANGENSSLGSIVALGGGGGGSYNTTGKAGGSGGGGGRINAGGAGTTGQGFDGGSGSGGTNTGANTSDAGAGGGGAGAAGANGVAGTSGGAGGDGLAIAFLTPSLATDLGIGEVSGSEVYFGGGGGGTPHRGGTNVLSGDGGLGGGGVGAPAGNVLSTGGTANTGGGGGAARSATNATLGTGGQGGSGAVLVRYAGGPIATGGDDIRTDDGYTYHTFTGTGASALEFAAFTGTSDATISGTMTGTGGFTWNSAGTLTLTAANAHTGDTVISEGTIALGSSGSIANSSVVINNGTFNVSALAGGYTVEAGTSLGGVGSVVGNLTINGTLAIGSSPGTMNFAGDLGLNGIADFEITDPSFAPGSFDLALGTGAVAFGGVLNLFFSGGGYTDGATVQVFDFDGGYSGGFSSVNFTGLGPGQSATFDSTTGFVTVIPEPGAVLLGGIGLLLLLQRRR